MTVVKRDGAPEPEDDGKSHVIRRIRIRAGWAQPLVPVCIYCRREVTFCNPNEACDARNVSPTSPERSSHD